MNKRPLIALLALALLAGCSGQLRKGGVPTETVSADPAAKNAAAPTETKAWPRQVTDAEGKSIEIKEKPVRIHTLSIGYDEISFYLVGPERFAAVSTSTANPLYSNVAAEAEKVPTKVGRKSEDVLAARPDLVVASPFANKDLVQQLTEAGLSVVVSDLQDSLDGHASNIRFLAHLYGEEERGEALIVQVEERLDRLDAVVAEQPAEKRPRVIYLTEKLNTPGHNSTVDGIIRRAGGINVAAEAGIERWQQITLEKVVELRPDVILVAEAQAGQKDFGMELLAHPALKAVPAVVQQRVYGLPGRLTSTLSHYNVRGAEELAKLLWPDAFQGVTFAEFQ